MPLSTAHFLATVVTARTTSLGSPDRLGVDDGGAGSRLSARQATQPFAQDGVYLLPGAVHAPSPEVVVGGLPGQGEVVGEQAPSTSTPEHVEDGVQYLARLVSSGTSARFGSGNEGLEDWTCVGFVDCFRLRTVRGKESIATNKPDLPIGVSPRSHPAG